VPLTAGNAFDRAVRSFQVGSLHSDRFVRGS
jgi:hypothetical protein